MCVYQKQYIQKPNINKIVIYGRQQVKVLPSIFIRHKGVNMSFITAHSFIFNGTNSADFGVTIGWINTDADVSTNGLHRELKMTANINRTKFNVYGSENTETISFHVSIVRADGGEITRTASIQINRWLMSSSLPQFLKFNDCDSYPLHYYAVCTQINDIMAGGRLVGKELIFETNSPYAFSEKEEKVYVLSEENRTFFLNNSADMDNGIYYPTITISTTSDTIVIENVTDQKSVTVCTQKLLTNASGSKVLTLNSENMTATDNSGRLIPAGDLGWDENYKSYITSAKREMDAIYWIRLLRGINEFRVSENCTIKIKYEFPRKAGCF